jgi:aspartate 1-decarboxylase
MFSAPSLYYASFLFSFVQSFNIYNLLCKVKIKSIMQIQVLKSKIHRVKVTEADLNYIGSITIDQNLMEAANVIEGERVQIVNINNGERLETYVIKGKRGSGQICLNGPAARKVAVGDVIIIISYATMEFEAAKTFKPSLVFPNEATNQLD